MGLCSLPKSKYYDKNIKKLVDEKKAQVIEVGKKLKIDKENIVINRIINTQDKTYIRYTFTRIEPGWSFPAAVIKVFDDKGRKYESQGAESSINICRQEGIINFDRVKKDAEYIILKLEWYDRKSQLKISLGKEGEINEN